MTEPELQARCVRLQSHTALGPLLAGGPAGNRLTQVPALGELAFPWERQTRNKISDLCGLFPDVKVTCRSEGEQGWRGGYR